MFPVKPPEPPRTCRNSGPWPAPRPEKVGSFRNPGPQARSALYAVGALKRDESSFAAGDRTAVSHQFGATRALRPY
ncbi:hypothetical protein BDV10DRAFT_179898 [Aspergillus recurvatus]